jgi:hypothetical protein
MEDESSSAPVIAVAIYNHDARIRYSCASMMIVVPRKKLVLTILSSITAGNSWKKTGRSSTPAIDFSKTVGFQRRSESLLMSCQ